MQIFFCFCRCYTWQNVSVCLCVCVCITKYSMMIKRRTMIIAMVENPEKSLAQQTRKRINIRGICADEFKLYKYFGNKGKPHEFLRWLFIRFCYAHHRRSRFFFACVRVCLCMLCIIYINIRIFTKNISSINSTHIHKY